MNERIVKEEKRGEEGRKEGNDRSEEKSIGKVRGKEEKNRRGGGEEGRRGR